MMENKQKDSAKPLLGGLKAGGTKVVCAIARDPAEPFHMEEIPTTSPEETFQNVLRFFNEAIESHGPISSLGIGTFGPADIHPRSPGYGSIMTTPREGWSQFNMVQAIRDGIDLTLPIAFDTDVNAAAVGESEFGAGENHRFIAYITIGTRIGGGFLEDGQILQGRMHPEIGHIPMPDFDHTFDKSTNVCSFHNSCFEGRASGTAIESRWGAPGQDLPADHPAWSLQAKYIAAGCISLTASWSPETIIIGGGVSQQSELLEKIRAEFVEQSGDYWALPPLDVYLQTPGLEQNAGIVGALCLARRMLQEPES